EDGVDFWHNVLTIDDDRCPSRCAQRHVQHGAVFRNVDLVTPEHGVDPLTQSRLVCELHEELQSLVRNAILRVIQKQTHRVDGQALAACGIIRKKLPQMQLLDLLMVSDESIPHGTLSK